jgi:hypothetical protein
MKSYDSSNTNTNTKTDEGKNRHIWKEKEGKKPTHMEGKNRRTWKEKKI